MNASFINPRSRFSPLFQVSLFAILGFAILRLALLVKVRQSAAPGITEFFKIFAIGAVYDIAFVSYAAIPFVVILLALPNRWLQSRPFRLLILVSVFSVLFLLLFNLAAEWLFWEEFSVRFNFISVDYLVYRREVTDNILESYPLLQILSGIFMLSAVLFLFIRKNILKSLEFPENFRARLASAVIILTIPVLAFLLLDQTQHDISDNNYVKELAANGPYQLFAAFRNNSLDYRTFYALGDDRQLSRTLKTEVHETGSSFERTGLYNITRKITGNGPEQKRNIILISVESLSAEYLSRFGSKENITPFMDEWFTQGMLFTNFHATGTRTTRGLEAITLSLPPTPGSSVVKRPDNDHMCSLGKVFKDHGYDTVFLYGGRGYFDNMNAFFSGNGYRIIDQTDLAADEISFKNAWGVADEDLYNRAINEADNEFQSGAPFFFHIMTTSNHRPYTYPEGKIDIPSGTGRAGAVKYADYALSQLIEQAKSRPWFADTLFVVVADHCAGSAGKVGLPVEKYHIPLFIYGPQHIKPEEIDLLASQLDLAPTLLALLNFSYESFFFGRNILAPDFTPRALIGNYQKLGLLKEDELLILSPRRIIEAVATPADTPVIRKVEAAYPPVIELMSFYQGADFVLRNRLNRW